MPQSPLIFLIAGEASGDQLGADLMASLKHIKNVRFAGVGGDAMRAQGLDSLFPMDELSLMGILGILRDLPNLLRRLKFTVETIRTLKPDVVVTIDSPEFSFRVMKRLHKVSSRPRLIHYVAPTVWAWRPGRAKQISRFLDRLFCIYPFEPAYFEKYGLKTTFVGHPVAKKRVVQIVDNVAQKTHPTASSLRKQGPRSIPAQTGSPMDPRVPRFREDGEDLGSRLRGNDDREIETPEDKTHYLRSAPLGARNPNLLCVLPGSRRSEVEKLLPIFKETVEALQKDIPKLEIVIPTVPAVEQLVRSGIKDWVIQPKIGMGDRAREEAFQRSFVALAASGTVALQLSASHLPFVIAYKLSKINAWIGGMIIHTPWACMVNILLAFQKFGFLKKEEGGAIPTPWIPEFIQQNCTAEKLAPALLELFKNQEARQSEIDAMREAILLLKAPPDRAARAVLEEI
jgi:lipid-A-disaccharide synthase